jgi:DNA repair protein RadC
MTASIVHPREVYKAAILANAAAIICGHNHPSGAPRSA